MNLPISERIRQIVVNMERCRWISPEIVNAKELIVVNIPSYKLNFFRDGKSELESPVVVGKNLTKTVIFSGNMSYIVFSPYWNLPQSIINNEVKPGMAKNPNYLESHIWNGTMGKFVKNQVNAIRWDWLSSCFPIRTISIYTIPLQRACLQGKNVHSVMGASGLENRGTWQLLF